MGLCRPSSGPRGRWIGDCYANRLRSAVPVPFRWQVVMLGSAQRLWLQFCKGAGLFLLLPASFAPATTPPHTHTYPSDSPCLSSHLPCSSEVWPFLEMLGPALSTLQRESGSQAAACLQVGCRGEHRSRKEVLSSSLYPPFYFQALSLIIPPAPRP